MHRFIIALGAIIALFPHPLIENAINDSKNTVDEKFINLSFYENYFKI